MNTSRRQRTFFEQDRVILASELIAGMNFVTVRIAPVDHIFKHVQRVRIRHLNGHNQAIRSVKARTFDPVQFVVAPENTVHCPIDNHSVWAKYVGRNDHLPLGSVHSGRSYVWMSSPVGPEHQSMFRINCNTSGFVHVPGYDDSTQCSIHVASHYVLPAGICVVDVAPDPVDGHILHRFNSNGYYVLVRRSIKHRFKYSSLIFALFRPENVSVLNVGRNTMHLRYSVPDQTVFFRR